MNKNAKRCHNNKIAIVLLVVLLCNFLFPNFAYAGDNVTHSENHLNKFFCAIGDLVLIFLQNNIVGVDGLKFDGEYAIKISPGIIFSGTLTAFDINFISPIENEERYTISKEEDYVDDACRRTSLIVNTEKGEETEVGFVTTSGIDFIKTATEESLALIGKASNTEYTPGEDLIRKSDVISYIMKLQNQYKFYDKDTKEKEEYINTIIDDNLRVYSWWFRELEDNKVEKYVIYVSYSNTLKEELGQEVRTYQVRLSKTEYEKLPIVESIAKKMRGTIATWYNVSREIALVGLLCVLVYVGIRGVVFSSTQDRAKYKKLLFDWLTAIIIIFTLHYLISITLTATKAITDVFSANIVDEDGSDKIFSGLRNDLGDIGEDNDEDSLGETLLQLVMYYYMVIMTIRYTIQYFKRVIYMAFLTMIAPLIGLTYPLDKIKDGQAQAFTTWIREFVFNALLQPLHLVLYFAFIGNTAMAEFAKDNPILALIVLAFLPQAEKLLRKMFGFDKGGKLGNMEAAFGGAAVMNMINQLKSVGGGSRNHSGGGPAAVGGAGGNSNVRTVSSNQGGNPYEALITQGNDDTSSGGAQQDSQTVNTSASGANSSGVPNTEENNNSPQGGSSSNSTKGAGTGENLESDKNKSENTQGKDKSNKKKTYKRSKKGNKESVKALKAKKDKKGTNNNSQDGPIRMAQDTKLDKKPEDIDNSKKELNQDDIKVIGGQKKPSKMKLYAQMLKEKRDNINDKPFVKGVKAVGKKAFIEGGKGALRASLKITGAVTLGTVGLAAGLATGDMQNVFLGATAGITAGSRLGGSVANSALNSRGIIRGATGNIRHTYEQGKYGEKEAEKRKRVREIKQTKEYKNLMDKFKGKETEVDKFLNAGITDMTKIRIALNNSNSYSTDNAIAYMHMADLCPAEIFEDRDKFNTYLESHGISKSKADEIYRAVRDFR